MQGTTKVLKYYFKGYFRFGKICEIHLNESLVTSIHKFARYNTHTHTHTHKPQIITETAMNKVISLVTFQYIIVTCDFSKVECQIGTSNSLVVVRPVTTSFG